MAFADIPDRRFFSPCTGMGLAIFVTCGPLVIIGGSLPKDQVVRFRCILGLSVSEVECARPIGAGSDTVAAADALVVIYNHHSL